MLCLTTCAVLVGCATPNSVVYSAVNAPPRPFVRRAPASVEVFVGKPPVRPHVDVGIFEVYQGQDADGVGRSTEDMLRTLRLHAALRGCDALQVMGVELAGKRYERIVRGVCDMYTDPQSLETHAQLTPERLPGEGQSCAAPADPATPPASCSDHGPSPPCVAPVAAASASTDGCLDPLVCVNGVCASPYQ